MKGEREEGRQGFRPASAVAVRVPRTLQEAALSEFLRFASQALLLWPSPTAGSKKRKLVRCRDTAPSVDSGMLSGREAFVTTGPFAGTAGLAAPSPPSSGDGAGAVEPVASGACDSAGIAVPSTRRRLRGKQPVPSHFQSHSVGPQPQTFSEDPATQFRSGAQTARALQPTASSSQLAIRAPSDAASDRPASDATPTVQFHRWSYSRIGGRWVCEICMRSSRLPEPPRRELCPGMSSKLQELVQNRRGHSLACCDFPNGILFYCMKCGCMTEGTRLAGLGDTCKRKPQSGKAGRNLSRIARLWHPNPGRFGDQQVLQQPVSLDSLVD